MVDETLRTTRRSMHGRDMILFPEAQRAEGELGCPRHYAIRVTRARVCFTFDALFLPPDTEAALDRPTATCAGQKPHRPTVESA
jgi:hypothetical protein